jgi:hypothetical protein
MMSRQKVMAPARRKVERAKHFLGDIRAEAAVLPRRLYAIEVEEYRSTALLAEVEGYRLVYNPKDDIADHFSEVMGDAVNNLREAMDYWMNGALAAVGQARKTHFPFTERHSDLAALKAYKDIANLFPAAAAFIDAVIRPSRDTNPDLWAITNFSNLNKHNGFIPNVAVTEIRGLNLSSGGVTVENATIQGSANSRISIVSSSSPIQYSVNATVPVSLTFPADGLFAGLDVGDGIQRMINAAEDALDKLEQFLADQVL